MNAKLGPAKYFHTMKDENIFDAKFYYRIIKFVFVYFKALDAFFPFSFSPPPEKTKTVSIHLDESLQLVILKMAIFNWFSMLLTVLPFSPMYFITISKLSIENIKKNKKKTLSHTEGFSCVRCVVVA